MNRALLSGMAAGLVCLLLACGDNAASSPADTNAGGGVPGPAGGAGASQGGSGGQAGAEQGAGGALAAPDAGGDVASTPQSDAAHAAEASDGSAVVLPARVLLYSLGSAGVIPTIAAQLATLKTKLGAWGYTVDASEDPATFTDANLARYGAVGMINTCFSPFGNGKSGLPESQALQKFLKAGGGLFGTHCASVTYQSANPPALYNQLIGGRGANGVYDGASDCRKIGDHPSITGLPATFKFTGNLDNTDFLAADTVVLVKCMWLPPGGGGKDVAVSWSRTEGLGRVFYTDFAKVDADLTDVTLGDKHITPGLAWVVRLR